MSRDYKSRKSSKSHEKSGSAFLGGFVGYALGLMSAIGIWLYLNYAPSPFLPNEKTARLSEKSETRPVPEQAKTPPNPIQEEPLSTAEEKPRFDFYKILPGIDEPEIDPRSKQTDERPTQPPITAKIPESSSKPVETVRQAAPIQPMPVQPTPTQPSVVLAETKQHTVSIPSRNLPAETVQQSAAPQTKNTKPIEKYFLQAGSFRKNDDAENLKARLALLGVLASVQPIDLAEKGIWYRVRVGPFTKKEDVDETSASLRENGIATQFIKAP
ncbi:SPOR domain-containing protein [Nitrosomonas sp. Nm166]|uniref:SPOR domain-containing protein n=1 Tax=Nitrosomonas sp. Nm166 TaxID=1881054 RepID=UPI0008EC36C8|nr:SPOR domain-containing protein [Nitrosomonas sp. Nm166]SFE66974.1 Cell division protein FtsN [Nitrosomonas sp. Nm166]